MGLGFCKSGVRPESFRDTLPGYSFINITAQKNPTFMGLGFCKSGVDLLSHGQNRSTISAIRLNFSVRNGKRWTMMQ